MPELAKVLAEIVVPEVNLVAADNGPTKCDAMRLGETEEKSVQSERAAGGHRKLVCPELKRGRERRKLEVDRSDDDTGGGRGSADCHGAQRDSDCAAPIDVHHNCRPCVK